jgi:glutamate-1-semialdehyde aminotransferase
MFGHQSTALLPDDYPQYFVKAKGAHLWDADGGRVLDLMCAYGPNLFGYGDEAIDAAFIAQLRQGDTLTGPTPVMVELAETLVDMVGHADWALFCKNGGDATTMALTVARAQTRRKTVIRARELCDRTGALLVLDEVRAGFRLSRDCSWSRLGVEPDLSTWGKGLANGHALSALLGSDSARKGAEAIYATGSFWYQAAPMAASLEVLRRIRETDYLERLEALGKRLASGLSERADAAGFGFRITGPGQMPLFLFDEDPDLRKGFFWSSAMLARGVYVHPWHNMFLCDAMTEADIDQALDAAEASFAELRTAAPGLAPVAKMAFLSQTR